MLDCWQGSIRNAATSAHCHDSLDFLKDLAYPVRLQIAGLFKSKAFKPGELLW